MREKINEEVSVIMYFSARQRLALPHIVHWRNVSYFVGEIGYHHAVKEGQTLHHVFELVDRESTLWFRLKLNTQNLHWTLEAVHDGNAN